MKGEVTLRFRDVAHDAIGHCLAENRRRPTQLPVHPPGVRWDTHYRGRTVRVCLPPLPPDPDVWGTCDSPVVWEIAEAWLAEHGITKAAGMKIAVCWHMVEVD